MSSADKAFTVPGLTIIGGLLVCILGIAANGRAGLLREKAQTEGEEAQDLPMLKGILICLAGGLLASGCNLAFHVGNNVGEISAISEEQFGNPPYLADLSVWMLVFIGAGKSSMSWMVAGLAILIVGIVIIAFGNSMMVATEG
jgi:L-rhamnose-H+ transport protein